MLVIPSMALRGACPAILDGCDGDRDGDSDGGGLVNQMRIGS